MFIMKIIRGVVLWVFYEYSVASFGNIQFRLISPYYLIK